MGLWKKEIYIEEHTNITTDQLPATHIQKIVITELGIVVIRRGGVANHK